MLRRCWLGLVITEGGGVAGREAAGGATDIVFFGEKQNV